MRGAIAAAVAASAAACVEPVVATLPCGAGAKAAAVAVESEAEVELFAFGGAPLALAAPPRRAVTALCWDEPFESLMIPIGSGGRISPASGEAARPLPRPARAFVLREGEWAAGEVPPAVARFRVPAFDPVGCASGGGCHARPEADEIPLCKTPCEAPPEPAAPEAPRPPAPAARPNLACPAAWARAKAFAMDGEDFSICTPPARLPRCPPGSARFGGAACAPVLAACPAEAWPARGDVFVRAGATGGDGSLASPFGTIAEALLVARPRETVALARGRYTEQVVLPDGVSLAGVCAAEVVLAHGGAGAVLLARGASAVRGVTLSGGDVGLEARARGAAIEVEDVAIEGARALGWAIGPAARAEGRRVIVRSTGGPGLTVEDGALELGSAVIAGATGAGVRAEGAARVALEDLEIADIAGPSPGAIDSVGVDAVAGASVAIGRADIAGVTLHGVWARGRGTRVQLAQVTIDDTGRRPVGPAFGSGVYAEDGARVSGRELVVRGWSTNALTVEGATTSADLDGVALGDGAVEQPDAVFVLRGGRASLAHASIRRGARPALHVTGSGSRLLVADAVITSAANVSPAGVSAAVVAVGGAGLGAARTAIEIHRDVGVFAGLAGTTLALEDVFLSGAADPLERKLYGVLVSTAAADVKRLRAAGHDVQLEVAGHGTTLRAEDLVLGPSRAEPPGAGSGVRLDIAASATIARVRARGITGTGVTAAGGSRLDGADLDLDELLAIEGEEASGSGVFSTQMVPVRLARVRVLRAARAAVVLGHGGGLAKAEDEVADLRVAESGGGLFVDGDVTVKLRRAAIEDIAGIGLETRGRSATDGEDVRIARIAAIAGPRRGESGTGAIAGGEAHLDLRAFVISEAEVAAVEARGNPELHLVAGAIERSAIGVRVLGSPLDLLRALDRVRFTANTCVFEPACPR